MRLNVEIEKQLQTHRLGGMKHLFNILFNLLETANNWCGAKRNWGEDLGHFPRESDEYYNAQHS